MGTDSTPPGRAWDEPSEGYFSYLVVHDPAALLSLLEGGALESHLLTFAAEIAGDAPLGLHPGLISLMQTLLQHPDAPVREGAVYGLAKLLPEHPHLRSLIEAHADSRETSPGVQRAAWSILD